MKYSLVMLFAVLLLSGCALTQQNPYTACQGQPLCTAYGTYATVAFSTAYALNHGTITVETAQAIQSDLDEIHKALDALRPAFMSGQAGEATYAKLAAIRAALHGLMQTLPETQQ